MNTRLLHVLDLSTGPIRVTENEKRKKTKKPPKFPKTSEQIVNSF